MKRKGAVRRRVRVLHVEDDERWLEIIGAILHEAGFQSSTASTSSEAWGRLRASFYHMVILDLGLDVRNTNNIGGMELLKQFDERGLLGGMSVIIMSAYANKEVLRKAFSLNVANVLDKVEFDALELVKVIAQELVERVRINLELEVRWEHVSGPEPLVLNLKLGGERVKRDSPLQALAAAELDDLLCRLFYDARAVEVSPLEGDTGGHSVLWARPFYEAEPGQTQVVKFGDAGLIEAEYRNYKAHVRNLIGGGRCTSVEGLRRTARLGGLVYRFLGSSGEQYETFGSFYARADPTRIKELLDRLFLNTCGGWYAAVGKQQLLDLADEYRRHLDLPFDGPTQARVHRIEAAGGRHRLRFESLGDARDFTDPLPAAGVMQFTKATYACVTHGQLTGDNVLVDDAGYPWLINFSHTGPAHVLRDLACLDSFVRFRLLAAQEATLAERLLLEESLCAAASFKNSEGLSPLPPSENPAVCKVYAVSLHLRELARRLMPQAAEEDTEEYYVALFYYALDAARYYAVPAVQSQHALLSASLIADQLSL